MCVPCFAVLRLSPEILLLSTNFLVAPTHWLPHQLNKKIEEMKFKATTKTLVTLVTNLMEEGENHIRLKGMLK